MLGKDLREASYSMCLANGEAAPVHDGLEDHQELSPRALEKA